MPQDADELGHDEIMKIYNNFKAPIHDSGEEVEEKRRELLELVVESIKEMFNNRGKK